jgi:hypothetical protein
VNGDRWNLIGETDLPFSSSMLIGLAVAAKNDGSATAVFDHVELKAGQAKPVTSAAGVEMRNGTLLAGEIVSADNDKIRLRFHGQVLEIKSTDAARMLFRSVPAETEATLSPGKKGFLLASGDFAEGDFSGVAWGQATISSVLFGKQSFNTGDGVLAILLNDVTPTAGYAVTASDRSIYRVASITIAAGKIQISDPIAGTISLSGDEVKTIVKSGE